MRKSFTFIWILVLALMAGSLTRVHTQEPAPARAIPKLSAEMQRYYQEHPAELRKFLESLPPVSQEIVPTAELTPGAEPVAGSWSSLTHPLAGHNLSNPILLTNGTVIAHESCTSNWWKFTPSNTGSYIDGTWSAIASTAAAYGPRFFGSGVLPDGRIVIEGGEYNGAGCGARTSQGAVYDPVANTWTPIAPPAGWGTISDAAGIVLPNGTYMQTSCCDNPPHTALLNPTTLSWTPTGTGKFDVYDEESMALLHDGTVLTVDAYVFTGTCGTNSERYTPATGAWASAGSTIIQQSDCSGMRSFEAGPLVMRPDGTAVSFSGRTSGYPQTAIFNVATHTWSAGPVHPSIAGVPYTMADAPAAMLPNGNILVAMSPSNWPAGNTFPAPTHYWELNADDTWAQVPDKADAASWNSFEANFILLPTGQVMAFTIDGPTIQIYTPGGTFANAWRPTISSVPTTLSPSQVFTLSGTQLSGLTEGTYYGDDTNASTNFPLVRIRNNATGHIFYTRTFNHSSRSIAPGVASSTRVAMPASIETGASTLEVVANGIPSVPVSVTVAAPAAAVMMAPAPGSTIGGTVKFGWTAGVGASQYWLDVGTAGVGSSNIYSASTGTTRSATVSGVPTTGTIYVRLWTLLSTGWAFRDYTYTGGAQAAVLTTPPPGSMISGNVMFGWTTGIAASQYWLYVGTTGLGSFNIYSASTGISQQATVSAVPATGTVYVRLWTLLPSGWTFHDYTYVGGVPVAAAITTPTPATMLAASAATFNWNTGVGIRQYWLSVGNTGVGSLNIHNGSAGTALSAAVSGLPTAGTIYVRLWSLAFDGWRFRDYTYTGGLAQAAVLTTPRPGSTLGGSSQTFRWNSGNGSSQYSLYVGTTGIGSANIFNASSGTALSQLATGIPTSGAVYVRLWSLLPTGWTFKDYTYTGGQAAEMTIPPPSTILSGPTATFGWTAVSGATQYWLDVGTTGVGSTNIFNSSTGSARTATVGGIPTSGTIYVRLWTRAAFWQFNDYTYTGGTIAAMDTPLPASALSSSTTTFGWNAGSGVDQYYLYVGTTGAGSRDIYGASTGTTRSASVSNLPTSGTIYVRLWSHLISGWTFNDYTYTGRGAAAIKWPRGGSTLSGSSVTFDWDAGNAVSTYWLYVGTAGVGSANIYSASAGTARSATATTVPTSGIVFVRLWSLLPTGWTFNDYTYTGAP